MQHYLWHVNRHRRGNLRRTLENDQSWGFICMLTSVPKPGTVWPRRHVYGQDFEWFLALLSRGIGALRGGRALSRSHHALPTPHHQEQLSRVPPTAQEGRPSRRAGGPRRLSPPPELLSPAKRSCPSFRGSAGGGCPPQPSPEARPGLRGLTLAGPSELVNMPLPRRPARLRPRGSLSPAPSSPRRPSLVPAPPAANSSARRPPARLQPLPLAHTRSAAPSFSLGRPHGHRVNAQPENRLWSKNKLSSSLSTDQTSYLKYPECKR